MNTYLARLLGTIVFVVCFLTAIAVADAPAGRYSVASGAVYDSKTKLTWQQTVPATTYTWAAGKTYCRDVGATLGGTGWRLPTRNELLTIVDYSRTNPTIDLTAFPSTPAKYFWSSTPSASLSSKVWSVNFFNGNSICNDGNCDDMSNMIYVRCVR